MLSSCDSNEPDVVVQFIDGPPPRDVADSDYTTSDTGLQYFDFVVGTGPAAAPGDTLFVDYTGWLTDGFIFDSSVHQAGRTPIRIIIEQTNVIPGSIQQTLYLVVALSMLVTPLLFILAEHFLH